MVPAYNPRNAVATISAVARQPDTKKTPLEGVLQREGAADFKIQYRLFS